MKSFVLLEKELAYYKKYAISKGFKYIKIELEANLDRGDDDDSECGNCEGDGYFWCDYCNDGAVHTGTTEAGADLYEECEECGGSGRTECSYCDGNGCSSGSEWDDYTCKEYILDRVSQEARDALVFGHFYNDGSVDSEFTFTIPVNSIELATEYIEAFNALGDSIGNGVNTGNAGMHLAFLNSDSGNYPRGNELDGKKLANFEKSVTKLIPALLFLGSSNEKTRGLGFRIPRVSEQKYSAINYGSGVLEYRFFETCYDRPNAILDFFIVMARTLEFYSDDLVEVKIKHSGELFIPDQSGDISNFYATSDHLTVLEQALKYVRPTYKTLEQLKAERKFLLTRSELRKIKNTKVLYAKEAYKQYKSTFKREKLSKKYRAIARWYETGHPDVTLTEYVKQSLMDTNDPMKMSDYVKQYLTNSRDTRYKIEY